ncbi:hypothetical protein [Streptomyces sp. NPDC048425]
MLRQVLSWLRKSGAHHTSYWIADTAEAVGDGALAEKIATRPDLT